MLIHGVTANMMMMEMPFLMNTTPIIAVPTICCGDGGQHKGTRMGFEWTEYTYVSVAIRDVRERDVYSDSLPAVTYSPPSGNEYPVHFL